MRDLSRLPKVELHLHLEGTLEPETVLELARRNKVELPYPDLEDLRGRYEFTDLQSFLDLIYANLTVLQTEEDFSDLVIAYVARAAAGGVRHVEAFFDPQPHVARGIPLQRVVDGLASGIAAAERDDGTTVELIACFHRDRSEEDALAMLAALEEAGAPIIGIGLDSAEVGNPPAKFQRVYARAGELGLHRVAHAGEEGGAASVTEALDLLHIERVDHGIQAIDDPALMDRLARAGTPLTMCPLSNVRLRCVDTLAAHPLPAFLEAGVLVTINSDDPAYFGGYADTNYEALRATFGFSDEVMARLARNSVTASFLPEGRKTGLLSEIDAWIATPPS
jgi:adenosine deaminase